MSDEYRRRGQKFRELAALFMGAEGIPVRPRQVARTFAAMFDLDSDERGDLQGLSDWAIVTRANQTLDPTGALREAAEAAEADSKGRYAAVLYRRGYGAGEQLAVLRLVDFAHLLKRADP
ncbi:hypothetical protein [Naasia aerilata]|uniref:Uncharacterized protein n=1 Tax=Naasia aerilata TaxID=1162966 RepID=A0ABN6XKU6_9MICO|nr:hypothetical protein [Naasia aerilata]BDZ45486.1 hypothetical protein GCM10025866_13950 [Naasia aerilata]